MCAPVAHRQFVFTIPKRLRLFFRFDRRLLAELPRLAWQTVLEVYRMVLDRKDVVPAVRQVADEPAAAAIGSTFAGDLYGVSTLYEQIQDKPNNITRFLAIGRQESQPSGDDKTTITFATADRPGALVDVLLVFRDAGINLSHIDKRPSGRTNWQYTFFIDCQGHRRDAAMAAALEEAARHCVSLRVLGSYPRARRVL